MRRFVLQKTKEGEFPDTKAKIARANIQLGMFAGPTSSLRATVRLNRVFLEARKEGHLAHTLQGKRADREFPWPREVVRRPVSQLDALTP